MGGLIEGITSIFLGGPKMAAAETAPAQLFAPPPESGGQTLTDTEANRMKNAVSKSRMGTKTLQIPLVGTNVGTSNNTPVGVNIGKGGFV